MPWAQPFRSSRPIPSSCRLPRPIRLRRIHTTPLLTMRKKRLQLKRRNTVVNGLTVRKKASGQEMRSPKRKRSLRRVRNSMKKARKSH